MDDTALISLKAKLDEIHIWPCLYVFKFIVKREDAGRVDAFFPGDARVSHRESSGGKYIGVTAETLMPSSDEVIIIYRRALTINGCIAL